MENSILSPATGPTLAPGGGDALTTPLVAVAVATIPVRTASTMHATISGRRSGTDTRDGRPDGVIRGIPPSLGS